MRLDRGFRLCSDFSKDLASGERPGSSLPRPADRSNISHLNRGRALRPLTENGWPDSGSIVDRFMIGLFHGFTRITITLHPSKCAGGIDAGYRLSMKACTHRCYPSRFFARFLSSLRIWRPGKLSSPMPGRSMRTLDAAFINAAVTSSDGCRTGPAFV